MKTKSKTLVLICALGLGIGLAVKSVHSRNRRDIGEIRKAEICERGDINYDGRVDIGDAIHLLNYLFLQGPEVCDMHVGILSTGQTKCYDDTGNEIDCENEEFPGQDGFYQKGMAQKYIDNDDTITDLRTGLMWQKRSATRKMTWREALQYCENLELAGYTDWRLPNINELHSLAIYGRYDPAADSVFEWPPWPHGCCGEYHWSSSTNVFYKDRAWRVYFPYGSVDMTNKSEDWWVRAVRDTK